MSVILTLRHCEEHSDGAIHSSFVRRDGLLRLAHNDDQVTQPATAAWWCDTPALLTSSTANG